MEREKSALCQNLCACAKIPAMSVTLSYADATEIYQSCQCEQILRLILKPKSDFVENYYKYLINFKYLFAAFVSMISLGVVK